MSDGLVERVLVAVAGNGTIDVVGSGEAAEALREGLASRFVQGGARPAIVVDATGDARSVQKSLERVADLGVVVLAGLSATDAPPLDLYKDLHVRGLTLLGVAADAGDA